MIFNLNPYLEGRLISFDLSGFNFQLRKEMWSEENYFIYFFIL